MIRVSQYSNRYKVGDVHARVKNVCRMVHTLLKRAVQMRECLCTASETETLAKVVAAGRAVVAIAAHDACLDGHALTGNDIRNAWPYGGDDTCCLMPENEGGLKSKVAISTMHVIMNYRSGWSVHRVQ